MTDSVKGALLTMFGGMCWGVSGCVGQYLFTRQGMDSTWLVPIRLFLAGVILCIYYGVRNWRQLVNPWRSWRNARDLVIYGLAGVSFCQFTYFLTIQLSSAGVGTILQDLSPVLILLVVCIQQKRAPRLVFRPWRMNYVPNAAGVAGIAAVVLIGNVLAFSCYMSGVMYIGPQKSSLFSFAEPVTAAIISTLVLGSPFTVWDAIGFVCIFLMLVLLFISNEKQAKSAASA